MEWYDVRDQLKDNYGTSSAIWKNPSAGSCPFEAGKSFISFATSLIDEYFIGKESQIHHIYTAIKDNSYPYNSVQAVDLPVIFAKYMEYYGGMKQFVDASLSVSDEDEMDAGMAAANCEKIISRDYQFIDDLFFSEDVSEEMTINDAMKNVEMITELIDFEDKVVDKINCMKSTFNKSEKYGEVNDDAVTLYMQSTCFFIMLMVIKIVYTYHCVAVSMRSREPSPINKDSAKAPEYQIF